MEKLSVKKCFWAFAALATLIQIAASLAGRFLGVDGAGGTRWLVVAAIEFGAVAILIAFAIYAGRHYARRAEMVVNALHQLAAGDLTCKLKIAGKDDFSWLAYEYDSSRKALIKLVAELATHATTVSESAALLATSSDSITRSTTQQSEAASSIAAAVEQMAVSVSHVADNAREANSLSKEAGIASHEGASVIGNVVSEVSHIAEAVQHSSNVIQELGRQSAQIRSIVKVIDEVAEQTNLLALNAAIEAARAGEQGRGFAVVADEVRKLAERTASSTKEIGGMIETITRGTSEAVLSMQQGVTKVESGVTLARQAGSAITTIDSSTQRVATTVGDISAAIEEQRAATNEIARHVDSIAQMAESNSVATLQTGETARRLADMSRGLQDAVARFKF